VREYLAEDIDDLRRQLPLEFVLAEVGRAPDRRGRYFCLSHPDELTGRASADIWEGDDGERLGCWSCGAIRDVFEVIEESTGCTGTEAIAKARELARLAPAKTEREERVTVSSVRLELEYERSTTNIRWPRDVNPIREFGLARKEAGQRLPPVKYLMKEWGWRGDYRGRVVIPHRAYGGEMTGIRWRVPKSWRKDGRTGSQFKQLYGGWRLDDEKEVWLCEGETDCVWAAWHLERAGVGTAVALGTAAQKIRPDELQLMRGRVVVLVLDADTAGSKALERWRRELGGVAGRLIELKLDDGNDLCATAETPLELRELYA